MINTPKSLRLQIAIVGRTNVGKSSLLNLLANQDIAITSPISGTTTDVVEKVMELLPIGPVTFLDTAGIDDLTELSIKRKEKTELAMERADLIVLVIEPNVWTEYENNIIQFAKSKKLPLITIINRIDELKPHTDFLNELKKYSRNILQFSSIDFANQDSYLTDFKLLLLKLLPQSFTNPQPLIGDLVPSGGLAIFIVPIDLQAPKGRLILPQVQAIRDMLDNDSAVMVVKEREYKHTLSFLNKKPDLVVCDSQVVMKMVADTPNDIKCTTFSLLFSRFKGDLVEEVKGAALIDKLIDGDKVLIAEACSHHSLEDDIGKIKIPRWLRQYTGADIDFEFCAGKDYPKDLDKFKVVIHCGACMLTRQEKLIRIEKTKNLSVPITNYGICISHTQGVLRRVLSPFPNALETYDEYLK